MTSRLLHLYLLLRLCTLFTLRLFASLGFLGSVLENACDEKFTRLVGTAHQRTAGGVQESQLVATCLPVFEFFRRNVFDYLQVPLGGLHVLTQGETIHTDGAKICVCGGVK